MRFPCPPGHAGALHPLVEELKILLTPQGRLKSLDAAVKAGVQEGISELTDWGILNGQDFLQHASCLLEYWIPSENSSGTFLYEVLTMFYCEFFLKLSSITASFSLPWESSFAVLIVAR